MDALSHALAGAVGGVIAMALLYPLENIRTRLQVQIEQRKKLLTTPLFRPSLPFPPPPPLASPSSPVSSPAPVSVAALPPPSFSSSPAEHYAGTWDCVVRVCRTEGWTSLYTGLTSALVGVGVSSAVYFFWYHLFRAHLLRLRGRTSLAALDNLLIASVAGALNILCTLPIWVVNTRMTLAQRSNRYATIASTFRTIVQEEGVQGLYKGLLPSLILVSNPAIQFLAYEQLVRALSAYYRRRHRAVATTLSEAVLVTANTPTAVAMPGVALPQLSSVDFFVLGAVSKALATVLTYPTQSAIHNRHPPQLSTATAHCRSPHPPRVSSV